MSKYVGTRPHPARPGTPALDTGSWNSAFQDFRAEVRFQGDDGLSRGDARRGARRPEPLVRVDGHSAFGRNTVEGQFGINVGRVLDPLLPDAYLQARYIYAVPEKYDRHLAQPGATSAFDLGYFVTGSLTVSVLGAWTKTHGGWRATVDFPPGHQPGFLVSRPAHEAPITSASGAAPATRSPARSTWA